MKKKDWFDAAADNLYLFIGITPEEWFEGSEPKFYEGLEPKDIIRSWFPFNCTLEGEDYWKNVD